MDLFTENAKKNAPLAERMRPNSLEEFIGQQHIVGKDSLLSRAIKTDMLGSCIFYGPPGTGKTTLAHIISQSSKCSSVKLNAVSSGVADAKKVIDTARSNFRLYGKPTYLLLDECHRWNKAQSDSVLSAIEEGCIIFIGSTTENPYVNMTRAIVSRCRVFEFKPLKDEDIKKALLRAVEDEKGLGKLKVKISEDALKHYVWAANGDLRTAYNALELATRTTPINKDGEIYIDKTVAEQSIQVKALSIDETMYFDILSAFCKSLRGSDATAALYYANRLIEAGCQAQLIARRTICHASEDCNSASALNTACNALFAINNLGMPEGNLALTQAIIAVCEAPKTDKVVRAMNMAIEDARNHPDDNIPAYLKNHAPESKDYKYPHNYPNGVVEQQYLPDSLKDRCYFKKK